MAGYGSPYLCPILSPSPPYGFEPLVESVAPGIVLGKEGKKGGKKIEC